MSKDDKTPPENSANSKDPKDPKDAGSGTSKDTGNSKAAETSTNSTAGEKKPGSAKSESKAIVSDKDGDKDSVGEKASAKTEEAKTDKKSAKSAASDKSEDGDSGKSESGTGKKARRGAPKWVAVASVVILVIGVAAAVWQAIGYFQDRSDKNAAALRDEVIDVASQVVVNSLSLSADTIDEDQERLRADSTGEFLRQQDEYAAEIKETVTDQGATTSAQVSNAALSEINDDAGTATVLLVYTAQSERKELPPVSGRQAARVELVREGDDWKVADMVPIGAQVPVGESSDSVQQLGDPTGAAAGGADSDSDSDSNSDSGAATGDDKGTGSADSSSEKSRDADASPTTGASATTAGGN